MVLENSYFDHVNNPWNIDDPSLGQLKQSGSIAVNCTGAQVTGGSAFTPSSFYSYTLDPAAGVPSLVTAGSGPQADISM
jgi:pectate lyase